MVFDPRHLIPNKRLFKTKKLNSLLYLAEAKSSRRNFDNAIAAFFSLKENTL